MNHKLVARIMAILLALIMLLGVIFSVIPYADAAPTQAQLDALKDKQSGVKQQLQDIQSTINSLEYERKTVVAKKEVLDEKIDLIQQDIDNIIEQIATYESLITEKEAELVALEEEEASQRELYKVRIRAMQENGTISYYSIIFGAKSFTDMLFRIDIINSIMEHDEQIHQNLIAAQEATRAAKADIEATITEREGMQAELEAAEAELLVQVDEASALIAQIEENLDEAEKFYDELNAEQDELLSEIAKMEEEIRQATAVKGTGTFIWPSDKKGRVTSFFGWRTHPVLGGQKYHNGVDIGGLGYGANIVAADGGTVVTATKSSSYGYYIVISHGNGYSTLYAHCSKLLVKKGDTVKQGDIIALVGSTGISNGPHIHLEIWKNGERVNPLDFYTDYDVSPSAW